MRWDFIFRRLLTSGPESRRLTAARVRSSHWRYRSPSLTDVVATVASDIPGADDGRLRRLDERLVPVLRTGASRLARVLGGPARLLLWFENRVFGGRVADFGVRHVTVIAFLTVAVAFSATVVHVNRYPELRDAARDAAAAARQQTVRVPGSTRPGQALAGAVAAVGPSRGTSVATYLTGWEDRVDDVPDSDVRFAVISFTDFASPSDVTQRLGPELRAEAVQYRLQLDGAAPGSGGADRLATGASVLEAEVIDGDIGASVKTVVAVLLDDIVQEEQELTSMLETTDEEAFRTDFTRRLDELGALRNTLASGGRIVFAVVVRGDGGALRRLAEDDTVRVVEVAEEGATPDDTDFFGLLPTDKTTVTYGLLS